MPTLENVVEEMPLLEALREFAQRKGTTVQAVYKKLEPLIMQDKSKIIEDGNRKTQGRWAKFAERVHTESPLNGLSEYVQSCSKEVRKDFALNDSGV